MIGQRSVQELIASVALEQARWERLKEILHQVLQVPREQRAAYLDEACTAGHSLRIEIESLLSAEEDIHSTFLQQGPSFGSIEEKSTEGLLEAGHLFAQRFQLDRKLGEGGMGQVWLADQIHPVRRQVAIKLIRAGMYDEFVLQRFQAERQSLAIMDHPAIAKIFDADATPQGQPYLVMEYVAGLPITEYCDTRKLGIRDRLELFIKVCEGVQHAHQKAVIHRDLKPANILLVEVDGKPAPRIIDFGLAKATTPLAGAGLLTQAGLFMGTPGYMSPEQADSRSADIDTRSDVYSLGVVLYVLLTGGQPLDFKQWKNEPLEDSLRRLREEEPPLPSHKVMGNIDAAEARGADAKQLAKMLRGDLDWITMKALEKDRERRYNAPSDLALEIRRYLRDEAVLARPASAAYQLRKYVRRHRAAVAIAAGLIALVAAFFLAQSMQLRRTARERDRANFERDRATRVTDFIIGMFRVTDPNNSRGGSVTARQILDKAAEDLQKGLEKDPEVKAQLMQFIAGTYVSLGLYARAHELNQRALDARLRLLGPDDPKTLESMTRMGWIMDREGHDPEAEKMEQQALAGEERVLGTNAPLTLETMDHLAVIEQGLGRFDKEEKLERQVIETSSRSLGPESSQALISRNNLAVALLYQGRYPEAERDYRQLLEVDRRVLGPDHPETLLAVNNLALAVASQGRSAEAVPLLREAVADAQRVLGPEHRNTALAMENLGGQLVEQGHREEGEKLLRQACAIYSKTLGTLHAETLMCKSNLAEALYDQGKLTEAEQLQRESLATQLRLFGPEDRGTLFSQTDLAKTLLHEGRDYAQAEKLARSSFQVQLRTLGPLHPDTLGSLQAFSTSLVRQHRYPEAESLYRDIIDQQNLSKEQGDRFSVWYNFACLALAANHPNDALQYLHEAVQRGYKDADNLLQDPDLKRLHDNPRFQNLVAELKTSAH